MMDTEKKSERISQQIEDMILAADDPKDKGLLLVLNKIADSLDENTRLTRTLTLDLKTHTEAFERHEETEMALINQGRGAIRVALFALAFFQAVFAWYFQQHLSKTEKMASEIVDLQKFEAEHRAHHEQEKETYKALLNKKD